MAKKMRLSLNINAFDASELIGPMLTEIRGELDYVLAIYQSKSYWGNPMAKEDMDELKRLKEIGLIDEIVEFKGDMKKYSREQECDKRNWGIDYVRKKGFTHVISSDADEFYDLNQFQKAKETIRKGGYTSSYCTYVNYYRDFDHYLVYPFRPLVPFIQSTYFKYTYQGSAPGPTDPTRRISNPLNLGCYLFKDDELRMGHAAWVRKDIRKKLVNWSAKNHFPKELIDKAVKRWENWKIGDKAIMLFNVPDNSVSVKKLETRIHDFDIPWKD
jgi:hypothetical protein